MNAILVNILRWFGIVFLAPFILVTALLQIVAALVGMAGMFTLTMIYWPISKLMKFENSSFTDSFMAALISGAYFSTKTRISKLLFMLGYRF